MSVGAFHGAAYDPQSGKAIWWVNYRDGFSNVPRPVYGRGLVYIATWFQEPSLLAIRVDGLCDVTKTHIPWTLRRSAPLTPSPLLVGDELYAGNSSASPVFADGRIYFLAEDGVATVIAPGKAFRRLAMTPLEGVTLASMAVSGGSILIRTDSSLYRIGAQK